MAWRVYGNTIAGFHSESLWVDLWRGPSICISNKFSGDAGDSILRAAL